MTNVLTPFNSRAFGWLWCSSLTSAAATGMERTATAWLALVSDGGAFGVGLVLAARMLPSLLFGLASGTIADRADRPRVLVTVGAAAVPVMAGLGWLARPGTVDMALLVPLSFAIGCVSVFDAPARQALVVDTVPREVATNALALNAVALRLFMAIGAFCAGVLIPIFGVASCYLCVAAAYGVEAGLVTLVRPPQLRRVALIHSAFRRALWDATRLVVDIPAVRTLMVAGVACEVFAFSYTSSTPVFARDVLAAGAEGLGTLNAAAAVGGTAAVLLLSGVPSQVRREPVLGAVFLLFGASLVVLASTQSLTAAVGVLVVTGASAAAFDVLQQTLLQMAVPEEHRGRAVGLWVLGLGSGPFGFLEMGVLVTALGAPNSLLINGSLVVVAAAALHAGAEPPTLHELSRWGHRDGRRPRRPEARRRRGLRRALNTQGDMLPGTQSNEQCLECHDEAPPNGQPQVWRLGPRHMSLVGKDTVTLCQQMRTLNGLGGASAQAANERFIDHLGGDQLIGFAFEGRRGGAMLPEHSPEPPPMTQLEFVAAASRWINAGQAKCGTGWTGGIVQKTALRSNSPGSILSTDITVNVNGANSTARVRVVGSTIQDGPDVNGCKTYNHETFSADGSGPAVVAISVSPPVPGLENILPPGLPDMGIDVPNFASGGYQISFGVQPVPGEHHIEVQSVTLPPARACQRITRDPPYSYAAPGGSLLKPLGADQPDHLVGHNEKTAGGSTIITDWDLTEN